MHCLAPPSAAVRHFVLNQQRTNVAASVSAKIGKVFAGYIVSVLVLQIRSVLAVSGEYT